MKSQETTKCVFITHNSGCIVKVQNSRIPIYCSSSHACKSIMHLHYDGLQCGRWTCCLCGLNCNTFVFVRSRSEFRLWFCELQADRRCCQGYSLAQRPPTTEQNYQGKLLYTPNYKLQFLLLYLDLAIFFLSLSSFCVPWLLKSISYGFLTVLIIPCFILVSS